MSLTEEESAAELAHMKACADEYERELPKMLEQYGVPRFIAFVVSMLVNRDAQIWNLEREISSFGSEE